MKIPNFFKGKFGGKPNAAPAAVENPDGGTPAKPSAPAQPAKRAADIPPPNTAGKLPTPKKKLSKKYLGPAALLLAFLILLSQVADQGGSITDKKAVQAQADKQAKAKEQSYATGVVANPEAAAKAAMDQGAMEARKASGAASAPQEAPVASAAAPLPSTPLPGQTVVLPRDADDVLTKQGDQLQRTWEEINRRRVAAEGGDPAGETVARGANTSATGKRTVRGANSSPSASDEAEAVTQNPGFVGYIAGAGGRTNNPSGNRSAATGSGVNTGSGADSSGTGATTGGGAGSSPNAAINAQERMINAGLEQQREMRMAEARAAKDAARNANERWKNDLGDPIKATKVTEAQRIEQRDSAVFAGSVVNAVTQMQMNTALPGPFKALVTRDIYDSRSGSRVVICRGSTLMGSYRSEIHDGQERAYSVMERLITPTGAVINLGKSELADKMGQAGVPGELHTYFWRRMGIAALLAIESAVLEKRIGPISVSATPGAGAAPSGAAQILVKTAEGELKRQYAIPPNITVDAGIPVTLILQENIVIPKSMGCS